MNFKADFGVIDVERVNDELKLVLSAQGRLWIGCVCVAVEPDELGLYVSAFGKVKYDEEKKELFCPQILGVPAWTCALKRFYLNQEADLNNPAAAKWTAYLSFQNGTHVLRAYDEYRYAKLGGAGLPTMRELYENISSFYGDHVLIQKMDLYQSTNGRGRVTLRGSIEGVMSSRKQVFPPRMMSALFMPMNFDTYQPWRHAYFAVSIFDEREKVCNISLFPIQFE